MSDSRISVALAVYNGEKYLEELLASLERQTLLPFELVILDDCSSDSSLEIINKFSSSFGKKIFANERNMGAVYTFQKLSGLCNGEFIAFCDQDDIWLPKKLEWSFDKMKNINSDKPAVVFSDLSTINGKGELVERSFWKQWKLDPKKFSFTDILFGNVITGCTTLINKQMKKELLKMPPDIMMHDHWLALIAYSFGQYSFVDKPTVLYRSHNSSVTNKEKLSSFKIFFNDFKERSAYLNENVQQAIKFKEIYFSNLNASYIKELDRFIGLQQKGFLEKRLTRYGRSLLRKFR